MKKHMPFKILLLIIAAILMLSANVIAAEKQQRSVQAVEGVYHNLVLKEDGTVWASGDNTWGQLGEENGISSESEVQIEGLSDICSVSAGGVGSIALKKDGTAWYWGSGIFSPKQAEGLSDINAVAIGGSHYLALDKEGRVWAWGNNSWGQLGDGSYKNSKTPIQVKNLKNITAIVCGQYHNMALSADGSVWVWGDNTFGQLGTGEDIECSNLPIKVQGIAPVKAIAAQDMYCIALTEDDKTLYWGSNGLEEKSRTSDFIVKTTPTEISLNIAKVEASTTGIASKSNISLQGNIPVIEAQLANGTTWSFVQSRYGSSCTHLWVNSGSLSTTHTSQGHAQLQQCSYCGETQTVYTTSTSCVVCFPPEMNEVIAENDSTYTVISGQAYTFTIPLQSITSFNGKTIKVLYDSTMLELLDACAFSTDDELAAGKAVGTDITITQVNNSSICFTSSKMITSGKQWSGIINALEFEALQSGQVSVTIQILE